MSGVGCINSMRQVVIRNISVTNAALFKAHYCDSFWSRLRGLTFRRTLPAREGILLVQGRESRLDASIHMLGVFMDLAVIWLNANREVVDVQLARSWRPAYFPRTAAQYILELDAVYLDAFNIGDRVEISDERSTSAA